MRINLAQTKSMKRYLVYTTDDSRTRPFDPTRFLASATPQNRRFRPPVEKVRLAPGVPFGEDLRLSAEMMKTIPPEEIGRMMSGVEAAELILRQARQARMLTKDEEHRAVTNIAKLRELRGRRDGDT